MPSILQNCRDCVFQARARGYNGCNYGIMSCRTSFGVIVSKSTNKKNLAIFLLALILPAFSAHGWKPSVNESMEPQAIKARIQPIGDVDVDGDVAVVDDLAPAALGPDAGKKRYEKSCAVCHGAGIAGAPKFRDQADWADRMPRGIDDLLASAIKGVGGMPAKGTCMSCSDEELRRAIEHMVPQS